MKKLRPEIKFKGFGGLTDAFDDAIKGSFNITDKEYDFICENATDEDLDLFLNGFGGLDSAPTFTDKRKALEVRNKYLNLYNKE